MIYSPPESKGNALAEIKIDTGAGEPAVIALDTRALVLGRSPDVDLQINDQRLSRHHCKVELVGEKLVITAGSV